jgi:hypothetical protein
LTALYSESSLSKPLELTAEHDIPKPKCCESWKKRDFAPVFRCFAAPRRCRFGVVETRGKQSPSDIWHNQNKCLAWVAKDNRHFGRNQGALRVIVDEVSSCLVQTSSAGGPSGAKGRSQRPRDPAQHIGPHCPDRGRASSKRWTMDLIAVPSTAYGGFRAQKPFLYTLVLVIVRGRQSGGHTPLGPARWR